MKDGSATTSLMRGVGAGLCGDVALTAGYLVAKLLPTYSGMPNSTVASPVQGSSINVSNMCGVGCGLTLALTAGFTAFACWLVGKAPRPAVAFIAAATLVTAGGYEGYRLITEPAVGSVIVSAAPTYN